MLPSADVPMFGRTGMRWSLPGLGGLTGGGEPCPAQSKTTARQAAGLCCRTHRGEAIKVNTGCLDGLQFTGEPHAAILSLPPVQGTDAHRVASRTEVAVTFVPDDAGKDAVKAVPELVGVPVLLIQIPWYGGVRFAMKVDSGQSSLPNLLVVINFTIPATT